jgi:hypothetical protein
MGGSELGTVVEDLGSVPNENGGRNRIASIAPALDWLITKIDFRLARGMESPFLKLNS